MTTHSDPLCLIAANETPREDRCTITPCRLAVLLARAHVREIADRARQRAAGATGGLRAVMVRDHPAEPPA